ncbi:histone deacetylase 4 isoform X3 [Pangasianodon hypophthalmus]|uniref:histone deacetylase 4 isoform X3 n=1 Tax=Pangasianodon hypophthalmus TaxID=310915 RepID=UPI002307EBC2|nr:histone deacetylase 4 isoform X3 [Pangasianodon hypophthalmus]
MASAEVKQRLQRSILSRQSLKQAETQREMAHISELNLQHEHPNTPPFSQHRRKQLRRTVLSASFCRYNTCFWGIFIYTQSPFSSEFVLKPKNKSSSFSSKNPLHNSFRSSSNLLACQCSPPSDRSDHTSLLQDFSVHTHPQMDRNPSFIGPLKMWIQAPVTVPREDMLHHAILLEQVYMDTAVFTNPHLAVVPAVCISVSQHRPIQRCHSQPLILSKQPRRFHQHHCLRLPGKPSHTYSIPQSLCVIPCEQHHPVVEERTAVQEKEKVWFTAGEDYSMSLQSEFCEEPRSNESGCSSHLSPSDKQWQRRQAFRMHNRSHQPVAHTLSSPPAYILPDTADSAPDHAHSTGLVYDPHMLKKECICGKSSCDLKHAGKIPKVLVRLHECGVSHQCKWITGSKCSVEMPYQTNTSAVTMAANCVIELVLLVAEGRLRNGFAIVQPHGQDASHSSPSKSMNSFNPVALAAEQLRKTHNKRKILILDWDFHHCDITQEMFYTDPNVLHISLHRGDGMPSAVRGRADEVGSGEGEGFNVNVEWLCGMDPPIGDAEYLAAFRTVIKPIAQQFSPDVILISTGFNTVDGHPSSQGGLRVSAKCFGLLTQNLMELSGGRVVVVLERDHDVTAVCEASKACINALLDNKVASLSEDVLMKKPCAAAVHSLYRVLQIHSQYWSSVRALTHTVGESWLQAERKHSAHTDTASALALLSMTTPNYTGFGCGGTEPVEHDEDEDGTPT